MIARVVDASEWPAVEQATGYEGIGLRLPPTDCSVVVVEDGGKIVATMSVMRITQIESLWIAPEYRGHPGVVRSLLRRAFEQAKSWGACWVLGMAETPQVASFLERMGKRLNVSSFILPLGD